MQEPLRWLLIFRCEILKALDNLPSTQKLLIIAQASDVECGPDQPKAVSDSITSSATDIR